jgi:hypothetical protein
MTITDDISTSSRTYCYETSTHSGNPLKSNENDLAQVLIHFFNVMVKSQLEAQTEALKASYEYLKLMKIGKHIRKD